MKETDEPISFDDEEVFETPELEPPSDEPALETHAPNEPTRQPRQDMPMTASGPTLAYSRSRHRDGLREASDKELLFALKNDDESALDELIERKTEPLIKAVYRILHDDEEARDIVQVTFFRLWEHRQKFDERWAPNTWIYRIATNLAIDHLRSRQSKQKNTEPMRLHIEKRFDNRARRQRSELQESEVQSIFHELAEGLTEKQRAVFLLREVEGMASSEVAQLVGCRESTVRNHLFNARRYLREELMARYPEYAPG